MSKAAAPAQFISAFNGGHPGVTTSIAQAGLAEFFDRIQDDPSLREHRMIFGSTRDGMGTVIRDLATQPVESRATGLLAGLLRRI